MDFELPMGNFMKPILMFFLFVSLTSVVIAQPTSDQYLAAGTDFYAAKDYNKAVLYYQTAIRLNPSSPNLASIIQNLKSQIEADAKTPRADPVKSGGAPKVPKNLEVDLGVGPVVGFNDLWLGGIGFGGSIRGLILLNPKLRVGISAAFNLLNSNLTLYPYSPVW